ncbi:hypothetical protein AS219_02570 [Neorickettsia sp. 179522]|nr:hypothetical protein AS219_02570 [Neorickettsia sp. 179522]
MEDDHIDVLYIPRSSILLWLYVATGDKGISVIFLCERNDPKKEKDLLIVKSLTHNSKFPEVAPRHSHFLLISLGLCHNLQF